MTSNVRKIFITGIILALALITVSTASAATMRAQIDGMIVIGDQVFEGGELQFAPVGSFLAIRIDGRQVALVHRPERGRDAVSTILSFTKDARGFYHLRGIRHVSESAEQTPVEPLRFATIAQGDIPSDATHGVVLTAQAAR